MNELKMNLPDGWTSDTKTIHRCVVIETNTAQFVTVDLEQRFFSPGCGTPNPCSVYAVYPDGMTGRGWKDRLFNAAVDHLKGNCINESTDNVRATGRNNREGSAAVRYTVVHAA